jgi:hypothetical protein
MIWFVGTLLLALLVSSTPVTERRQSLARVITQCTEPNTVALTFVRRMALHLLYYMLLISALG